VGFQEFHESAPRLIVGIHGLVLELGVSDGQRVAVALTPKQAACADSENSARAPQRVAAARVEINVAPRIDVRTDVAVIAVRNPPGAAVAQ
jgi:hypothetical protein